MIWHLLFHKWKSALRSSFFTQGVFMTLVLLFLGFYFFLLALGLGFLLPSFLENANVPGDLAVEQLSSFLLYYLGVDVLLRFFLEQLNTLQARHYLTLPIPKNTIIHFLMAGSFISFFNLLFLTILIPFFLSSVWGVLTPQQSISWLVGMLALMGISHLIAIYLKRVSASYPYAGLLLIGGLTVLGGLNAAGLINFTAFSHLLFAPLVKTSWLFIVPLAVLGFVYRLNVSLLRRYLYEDNWQKDSSGAIALQSFAFLDRKGVIGALISQEIKLILRNKRTKMVLWTSGLFLFYGLLFFRGDNAAGAASMMQIFVCIFIVGGFLVNFGQFTTSWESAYWDGILTRKILLKDYLMAKWVLLFFSCLLSFFLALPYAFLGWKIVLWNFVTLVYLSGIGIFMILFFSTYNKKRIDLSKSSMFNYQGTGTAQYLMFIPVVAIPLFVFGVSSTFGGEFWGILVLVALSLLSLSLFPIWMREIARNLMDKKYSKADSFRIK